MALDAAALDVLDDMAEQWADKDGHGELRREYGYGDGRVRAFWEMRSLITDAWRAKVNYRAGSELD
ncbi:hypothetical protein [Streptomyces sp. DHE17-7]|uniref:hypothetical protein n=1 Tax=Streptomyces sp. DHE17-7 TaxID=2759949 RepID=UPI0022EA3BF9|nr:hypothetical protein [Streptomyces sp. DHE17-7]MBJ6623611.1 hypothetical protein [Streptomyces sp. DHE17-7]